MYKYMYIGCAVEIEIYTHIQVYIPVYRYIQVTRALMYIVVAATVLCSTRLTRVAAQVCTCTMYDVYLYHVCV